MKMTRGKPKREPSRGSQLIAEWRGKSTKAQAAELLGLDAATYGRFENGIRKPSASWGFAIERLTDGTVRARSWFEPPLRDTKQAPSDAKAA